MLRTMTRSAPMTVKQIRRIVRNHRGQIFVPVLMIDNVARMQISKTELLFRLSQMQDDYSPWSFMQTIETELHFDT